MSKCFISHAIDDREFVENELLGLLDALGIEAWYAESDIRAADEWERSILAGLKSSDWLIVVLSPRSAVSKWVKDELHWAMENLPGRIVPMLIETCEFEKFHIRLPRLQCINFIENKQSAIQEVVRYFVNGAYKPLRRAQAIEGEWIGHYIQEIGIEGTFPTTLNLTVDKDTIGGILRFSAANEDYVECTITGGCFFDRFLQLNYFANDPRLIQFGTILGHISDEGSELTGRYLGYGAQSGQIVSGKAYARRHA